ncbi:hypothetical protein CC86DRAFT_48909 [Ophiobolus disseminans]|uniref:Uncharacterized protein n=1 Tax=Ophiobolus disseminans TaxID=1469910 RepID=A0A6A6ZV45_9PLEO|nr:hypothetical protein CC86DRAFT_48909 [Ophiobolus disseminans]
MSDYSVVIARLLFPSRQPCRDDMQEPICNLSESNSMLFSNSKQAMKFVLTVRRLQLRGTFSAICSNMFGNLKIRRWPANKSDEKVFLRLARGGGWRYLSEDMRRSSQNASVS